MNRHRLYEIFGWTTLGVSGMAGGLAVVAAVMQQGLGAAAAALCAFLFLAPGVVVLGFSRRLRARDVALAHTAAFVAARESVRIQDLADELRVPAADAERILQTAIREGHVRGRFEDPDRFVGDRPASPPSEGGGP